jgi:hypothetical protein
VALLLVLGVVVVAAVLGYAMLSSAAMTRQVTNSAAITAGAQGMAESGVNLALYYLQNPEASPQYPTAYPATEAYERDRKFWTGTNGQFVDVASPAIGQVKVTVTRPNPAVRWYYEIEAVGRAPGSTLERKVMASTYVNAEYRFEHATVTTNDVGWTGNTRIEGDSYSNGGLSIRTGGVIIGRAIRRKSGATQVLPTGGWMAPPANPKIVPTFDEVRSYLKYELPRGVENHATVLTKTDIGSAGVPLLGLLASGESLGPTASNPAGVYYAPGDLTMHADSEVRGTLIVRGNLTILGTNVRIHEPKPGFPALVVGGNVNYGLLTVAPKLSVSGVMYVAGRIDSALLSGGLLPTVDVDGAMLVGGTSPVFLSLPLSFVRVKYNPTLANVPDFSEVGRTPISVKVLEWEAQ